MFMITILAVFQEKILLKLSLATKIIGNEIKS